MICTTCHHSSACRPKENKHVDPKETNKSISFNPSVVAHKYLHIDDYTDDECRLTWYNAYELAKIGESIRETLHVMVSNDNLSSSFSVHDDDHFCFRGLECLLGTGLERKHERKVASYNAVLDEQDLQWEKDIYDVEMIASVYLITSSEAARRAHEIALRDEQYVKINTCHKSTSLPTSALIRPPRLRKVSGTAA